MSCGKNYKSVGKWKKGSDGHVPSHAVQGGWDLEDAIYIGRAEHDGDVIPGKIVPSHGCCYVSFGGEEHKKHSYRVLTNPDGCVGEWVHASDGAVPSGAIQGGKTADGEPLFIGRAHHEGTLTVGKVHPSNGCLYVPFGGEEHKKHEYEVLTCKHVPLQDED